MQVLAPFEYERATRVDATLHVTTADGVAWFCRSGCRDAHLTNPAASTS